MVIEEKVEYKLIIENLNKNIYVSLIYQGTSQVSIPNFYYDYYILPITTQAQYAIKNEDIETYLKAIKNKYVVSTIIIGFYNNDESDGNADFKFVL